MPLPQTGKHSTYHLDVNRRAGGLAPMAIILAPSATGKSHFVAEFPDAAIDGDVIITASVGWPTADDWTTELGIHLLNWVALQSAAATLRLPILFNGVVWARPNTWYGLVTRDPEHVTSNIAHRAAASPGDFGTTVEQYITNFASLRERLDDIDTDYEDYTTFAAAVDAARAWLAVAHPTSLPSPHPR